VPTLLSGPKENGVLGVCLDVLLQVLRMLECLAGEVIYLRLYRDMNTNVTNVCRA
jgi:hypothetical protein